MNTLNINDIPTITKVNTCWRPKKAQPNPEGKGEAEKAMPNPEGKGEAEKKQCRTPRVRVRPQRWVVLG